MILWVSYYDMMDSFQLLSATQGDALGYALMPFQAFQGVSMALGAPVDLLETNTDKN